MAQAATGNKTKKIFDGRYEILSIVGRGSGSVVYRARHVTAPHNEVALKVLVNKKGGTPSSDQLRKEALAMVSSRHKFTIRLDDFHSVGQLCYLSMEYAPEGDLRRYIARQGGTLPIAQIERFMMQIAEALAFIHQAGILHRDIKPDNILVVNNRQVRLADFGVAVLPGEESSIEDLQKGVGTMDYMAPEVLEAIESTKRSDVYLFGVCFYELITGTQPFANVPLVQVIEARKNEKIRSLLELRPDCPPYLASVIERAMAFEAADRFPSARELFQTLLTRKAEATSDSNESESDGNQTNGSTLKAAPSQLTHANSTDDDADADDSAAADRPKRKRRRRKRSTRKPEQSQHETSTQPVPAPQPAAARPAEAAPVARGTSEATPQRAPQTIPSAPAATARGPMPGNSARVLSQLQEFSAEQADDQPTPTAKPEKTTQPAATPADTDYQRPRGAPIRGANPVLDSEPKQTSAVSTDQVESAPPPTAAPEKSNKYTAAGGSASMSALFGGGDDEKEKNSFQPPARKQSQITPVTPPAPAVNIQPAIVEQDDTEEDRVFEPIESSEQFDGYSEEEFYGSTTEERNYRRKPEKKNMDSKRHSWFTKIMIVVVVLFLADDQMQRWTSKGLAERAMEFTGIRQESDMIPFVSASTLPFPDLPEGKYSGVITGLIKDVQLPLSITRPLGSQSIFIAVGIPGWIPAEVSVTEEPTAVRVRSSGFILTFSGIDAGDRVQGTFINSISGEEGTWVVAPIRKR